MDQQHHDGQPTATVDDSAQPQRRKFLRHVGMAAAAAAVVGITDVAGAKSAFAATKGSPGSKAIVIRGGPNGWGSKAKQIQEIRHDARPDTSYGYISCNPSANQCGGACTPNGIWCHYCCTSATHARCAHLCVGPNEPIFLAFSY
jgi:hypothetical protein